MAQQQQQQHNERPGSAASGDLMRGSQAWEAQGAELQQLKAELSAAHTKLRDAGERLLCGLSFVLTPLILLQNILSMLVVGKSAGSSMCVELVNYLLDSLTSSVW